MHKVHISLPPAPVNVEIHNTLLQFSRGDFGVEYWSEDIDCLGLFLLPFKDGTPHKPQLSSENQGCGILAAMLHHIGFISGIFKNLVQNQMAAVRTR